VPIFLPRGRPWLRDTRGAEVLPMKPKPLVRRRLHRPPAPSPRWLFIVATFFVMAGLLGSSALVVGGVGTAYAAYTFVTKDLPDPAQLSEVSLPQVTQIYDRTGTQLLYEFYDERRIAIPISQVAPAMIQSTLAAEDVNFYEHPGFDLRGLIRAAITNLRTGGQVQGGSTITQQLVKRTLLTSEKSYTRKLKELALAVQVEQNYSKDQILSMYLNEVYYGNQAYGVEAAAQVYYGKHAADLDLAEASILAGLVQAPSQYDPVTNRDAALARQRDVLDVMVRYGMATQEEADAAAQEAAGLTYRLNETQIVAPHFSFFVRDLLRQRINPEVLRNGLKVITTLDMDAQRRAENIVRSRVDQIRWQHVNNGALVAIHPETGEILAMVGSYDYYNKAIDGQVNVATALRQPGSSFKVFTYGTAFASKKWVPSTTLVDQPIVWPDIGSPGGVYKPMNYDLKWHGVVTLRTAFANSLNIPALLVQREMGTQEVIKTARAMGITTDLPEVMSLTLGAGVVRLLDMTSAYGTFANHGVRVEPNPFLQISDREGHVIYELQDPQGQQVITPQVAYMISDVLSDNAARRMEFGNVLDLAAGRIAAVKTGTTNDYKDSWTIGFTPSLVTGVWVGNTDNSPMLQVAGSLGAGYIWKDFMEQSLKDQPIERFQMPPGVVRGRVCGVTDLYIEGTAPGCRINPPVVATPAPNGRSNVPIQPARAPQPTPVLPPR
jgi:1A family penicillin-binding protein